MFIPRPYQVVAIPTAFSLAGFWIVRFFRSYEVTNDVVAMFIIFQFYGVVFAVWLSVASIMAQAYFTSWKERTTEQKTEPLYSHDTGRIIGEIPIRADGLIPITRTTAEPLNQVVTTVRFDMERKVAKTLIQQRNGNFKVDLTEDFWIKRGNFGESRDKFVAMKDNWRKHGVIYKAGDRKNAPDEVADWRKVRLIADGHKLI